MQLTAAKLLNADVLCLLGLWALVMATRVAESWLKDFLPTSAVPNTAATVLDKMCTHSGSVLDCVVRNVQGHEGQLADTDQEGIQNGMFRMTNPWWRSPRARSLELRGTAANNPSHGQRGFTYPTTQSLQSWTRA